MLRTIAKANTVDMGDFGNLPCVGIYADVIKPGRVRRGDVIRILPNDPSPSGRGRREAPGEG